MYFFGKFLLKHASSTYQAMFWKLDHSQQLRDF